MVVGVGVEPTKHDVQRIYSPRPLATWLPHRSGAARQRSWLRPSAFTENLGTNHAANLLPSLYLVQRLTRAGISC